MDNFWGTLPDWLVGVGLAFLTFLSVRRVTAQEKEAQAEMKELQRRLSMKTLDNTQRQVDEANRALRRVVDRVGPWHASSAYLLVKIAWS